MNIPKSEQILHSLYCIFFPLAFHLLYLLFFVCFFFLFILGYQLFIAYCNEFNYSIMLLSYMQSTCSFLVILSKFYPLLFLLLGCRDGTVVRALTSHQSGPGSIPRLGVICGLSLLVLYYAPRGFLRVLRFPLSSKTNI